VITNGKVYKGWIFEIVMGFNKDLGKGKPFWEDYLGTPGVYNAGSVGATGVLERFEEGIGMWIRPSAVVFGEGARIEKGRATFISLGEGQTISMRPLEEGDMEEMVKDHLTEQERKKTVKKENGSK
jgi:hypothetical protein